MSDILVGGFQSLAVMAALFTFLWLARLVVRRTLFGDERGTEFRLPEIKPMAYRVRGRDTELPVYIRRGVR